MGAGREVHRRSLWVHNQVSRDRLGATFGQQGQKSGKWLKEKQRRVSLNWDLLVSLIIGSSEREAAAYFCLLKLVQGFLLVNSNLEPLNNGDYRCCLIKFKTEKCNAIATQ